MGRFTINLKKRNYMSNNIFDRVYNQLVERRERILSGKINCIPWGFNRFEEANPGIEQGKYYLVTANSHKINI